MPSHKRPQTQDGFSLIELMIACIVLMTGLLAVMSMVLSALSLSYSSKLEATALNLSQQKMEELKSLPLDDAQLVGPGSAVDANLDIDFDAGGDPAYTAFLDVVLNQAKATTLRFETRWHITTSGTRKTLVVATRATSGVPFRLRPASLKLVRSQ
ncbi:MAG: hypothetical protein AB1898_03775 [Acidobacteriota bacterium]